MVAVLASIGAAALSLVVVYFLRGRVRPPATASQITVLGVYSPVLTWSHMTITRGLQQIRGERLRSALGGNLGYALELLAVALWVLWVGRDLLNFNPHVWPAGTEFGSQVSGYHLWEWFRQCGLCSLWDGIANGGAPSLADPYTGALHPIPALATLVAGVVNGTKITLLASFWLAGAAQWWIGRTIGLGRWSRLWTALVAASGAHIVGRIEIGNIPLPLSTAAVSLALAASLDLALKRSRKAALRFALVLALAVVAGQGYLQIALVFWAPWIILLILTPRNRPDAVWREFLLAGVLAVLIAGLFVVPFLHFWPLAGKFSDADFAGSQPLQYIPLNLVIRDWDFFQVSVLSKLPYPYLYTLYIGWPAVLLAIVGLALGKKNDARLLIALAMGALTMFWLGSATPLRWLAHAFPSVANVRHPALMAGLAVPAVLALAGYGLDRLLQLRWPRVGLGISHGEARSSASISTAWLLLIPLVASLHTADQFDQNFLVVDDKSDVYQAVGALKTPSLAWVAVPFGEHYWDEAAYASGLKLTGVVAPFWWSERELAPPFLEATRDPRDLPVYSLLGDIPVYQNAANAYASVRNGSDTVPCQARGTGGDIRVSCDSGGGDLVVYENAWTGWTASVNGQRAPLNPGQWLSVTVPPGPVEARLRYLPLDALLGAALTLLGLSLLVVLWVRASRPAARGSPE